MTTAAERKRILLIDDTPTYLALLNHTLKDDYDILIAKDGEEGLSIAKKVLPDLILLDVVMPGISGHEVLKTIKSDEEMSHIPVILATGDTGDGSDEKGYKLGAFDYIKKPFTVTEVKTKVDSIMQA